MNVWTLRSYLVVPSPEHSPDNGWVLSEVGKPSLAMGKLHLSKGFQVPASQVAAQIGIAKDQRWERLWATPDPKEERASQSPVYWRTFESLILKSTNIARPHLCPQPMCVDHSGRFIPVVLKCWCSVSPSQQSPAGKHFSASLEEGVDWGRYPENRNWAWWNAEICSWMTTRFNR